MSERMEPARQVIREFRWREIFPWLMLLRVFRCSLRIHAMVLALAAVILINQGWRISAGWLLPADHPVRMSMNRPVTPLLQHSQSDFVVDRIIQSPSLVAMGSPLIKVFEQLSLPVQKLFSYRRSYAERAHYLLGFAWTLVVAGLFAGVICRTAAFDLASQERYGVFRACRFVFRRAKSFVGVVLIPLALLSVMLLPILALGLVAGYVSSFIASLFWGVSIAWGIFLGVVAVCALFSWPLYWPALASEDSDAFDALGSSIGYASQRPFSYLLYFVICALVTAFGLFIFSLILQAGMGLLQFGVLAGGGEESVRSFLGLAERPSDEVTTVILNFWEYFGAYLLDAYLFSAFWTSATGIFLLLRYDVDRAELDDIYRDGADDEKPMPKLAREMGLTGEAAAMEPPLTPGAPSSGGEPSKADG